MLRAKKVSRILDSHFRSVSRRRFLPRIRWRKQQEESSDEHFLKGLTGGKVHIIEEEVSRLAGWKRRWSYQLFRTSFRRRMFAPLRLIANLFRSRERQEKQAPDIRRLLDAATRVIDQISPAEFERIKGSGAYAHYQELRRKHGY
ncbi:hypothetical protein HY491_04820 [Candidatus Woesearchaeota archaeon]|nr:hypothetical protein [Candidatus Woesearchaeota archaeon]